ncbi:MAG: DUF3090 family protein [Anaerolineae bacterium]
MKNGFPSFAVMLYLDTDDVYPVTRITTGVLGDPKHRVYVLQAQFGPDLFSWTLGRRQAMVLARQLPQLLADIRHEFPELHEPLVAEKPNLAVSEPVMPLFRVGKVGLAYDRIHDLVVLTLIDARALEMALDPDGEDDVEESWHRIYTTRGQALLLSQHTEQVVAAGRPYCPVCDEPIDETGHFCMPITARDRQTGDLLH